MLRLTEVSYNSEKTLQCGIVGLVGSAVIKANTALLELMLGLSLENELVGFDMKMTLHTNQPIPPYDGPKYTK